MNQKGLQVKIFRSLGLAMGVASLVLLILKTVSTETALILLSLGLVAQGLGDLESGK